jgi:hypothetical protein
MYKVFTRNWWRMERGRKVPDPSARKTHIAYYNTEEEARAFCIKANERRPSSWLKLSRKYEYTTA